MPSVTIAEKKAAVAANPAVDFAMCFVGFAPSSPLAAGQLSATYGDPNAIITDYGYSDMTGAAAQAVTRTPGNPGPVPVCIYATPATTAGSYGSVFDAGVTGTAAPSANGAEAPTGTYQPWLKVRTAFTIGTAGGDGWASLDGGRTQQLVTFGTATTYNFPSGDGWPGAGGQCGFTLGTAAQTYNASDVLYTSTKPPQFGTPDLYSAGPPATGALAVIAESAQQFGMIVLTEPIDSTYFSTLTAGLDYFATQGKKAPLLVVRFRDPYGAFATTSTGSQTLPVTSFTVASTAGAPPSGTLTIGSTSIAYTSITDATTFGGCTGGTGTIAAGTAVTQAAETDAAYITACQTFYDAHHDDRILCMAGSGWLTDAFTGYRYLRSGMAAALARIQSFAVVAGQVGEQLTQSPGYVARGPLEGFSLVDDSGNLVGHDESSRGGISQAAGGPVGGMLSFYYNRNAANLGTYVWKAPVLYPVNGEILNMMDRRLANALERTAVGVSWQSIQGADIYDPDTLALDLGIKHSTEQKIWSAIRKGYPKEFQNANDPDLVQLASTVTVVGDAVTMTGTLAVRPYGYTDAINLTYSVKR
ncbi:MAG TPA: hypothetical protein VLT47_04445 [Anaeromyxobacteraceae bacterium]|nr:hypothetical protein [Anaeromyxobacteraceae bacterium]